jgi:hypothetical protein
MGSTWLWTLITTTFRNNVEQWVWLLIEDLYVFPRVSVSVAITWMVRKEHPGVAPALLVAAIVGVLIYFVMRRKYGPHRTKETSGEVFFVIAKRIVGVSVAGPFYRWVLAGMTEFRDLCLWSLGIWLGLITLSVISCWRKKADDQGWKKHLEKMLLEDIATPVHVAFSTPTVEWVLHGQAKVWAPLMVISIIGIILWWAVRVKRQGWPEGANKPFLEEALASILEEEAEKKEEVAEESVEEIYRRSTYWWERLWEFRKSEQLSDQNDDFQKFLYFGGVDDGVVVEKNEVRGKP